MSQPRKPEPRRPAAKPARKTKAAPKPNSRAKTAPQTTPAVRAGTKPAALIAMLQKPRGATVAQMGAKTGWQPHSVRAALTGLRKRGYAITRDKNDAGVSVYRIDNSGKGSTS